MRRVLRCPDCGSADLDYEAGYLTGQRYLCKRCGYVGSFVVQQDLDELAEGAERGQRDGEAP